MAGRDDARRDLVERLKARRAALAQATLDAADAQVGKPVLWPLPEPGTGDSGHQAPSSAPARAGRLVIHETGDGLAIHNPARRSWPQVLFLLFWLSFWWMGEAFALREIVRVPFVVALFLFVWLAVWTVAGVGVSLVVLWQMFGSERLIVVRGDVLHEFGIGPLRRTRHWPPGEAGGFAAAMGGKRRIVFTAGGRTRDFGIGLDADEIALALAAIRRHLPADPLPSS